MSDTDMFPPDGSEEPTQGEPELAPRPRKSRAKTISVPAGGEVKVSVRQPAAPVNGASTATLDEEQHQEPSLLELLGGEVEGKVSVERKMTKGDIVAATDTGFVGEFDARPDPRRVIQQRYGGGTYTGTGKLHGKVVSKTFELPGDSLPLTETSQTGDREDFTGGSFTPFGAQSLFDQARAASGAASTFSDERWWIWGAESGWRWSKNGEPTCPPPNNGLPPQQATQQTPWWMGGNSANQPGQLTEVERERLARIKAEEDKRLSEIESKHKAEMAILNAKLDAMAANKTSAADTIVSMLQAQAEKAETERKDRFEQEERRREREDTVRRDEREREETRRQAEKDKEEDRRREDRERRDEERKEERIREDRRREEHDKMQNRMFEMMISNKKEGGFLGQVTELAKATEAIKAIAGGGGADDEISKVTRIMETGAQVFSEHVVPGFAAAADVWRGGQQQQQQQRPQGQPQQRPQQPQQRPQQPQVRVVQMPQSMSPNARQALPIAPTSQGTAASAVAATMAAGGMPQAPEATGAAAAGAAETQMMEQGQPPMVPEAPEGGEMSPEQWGRTLDFFVKAYKAGNPPKAAASAFGPFCMGAGIDFEQACATMGDENSRDLLSKLRGYEKMTTDPLKGFITAAREVLETPEGVDWFEEFADIVTGA